MIRVSKLIKDYGNRRAINELDFQIERGEIVGFLGPNGAGKTTTMRILTGFMPPTSGTVEINGFDIMEHSMEVRQIIGYMPETVPLYPDMSVYEYVKFMADLRHVKDVENRTDEVIELVGLADRANSFIGNLSKGMRQRVGLAQALVHRPEVLILDEPTIGLDPVQIIEVRNLIREIGKEHTILLSTHILPEAQQVCDRVLIINKGKIVAEDSTSGLQARLTGAQRVSLQVKGDVNDIAARIALIPGVNTVTAKDDEWIEYESVAGTDIRPDVSRTVVTAGYDLLELKQISMSLEEIFLQLTRDDTDPIEIEEASSVENQQEER